jgi:flavin-dependent dehydrogenase
MVVLDVAIMGAGLSGLACAITLEKNGITPTIFEKRSRVGDRFVNGEVLLSIFLRPIHDCIETLSEKYGIYLQPTAPIQKMEIYSKHQKAVIEGHLGFTNIRGRDQDSYECQLQRQTNTEIIFNSTKTYEELQRTFTHVVMATGDGDYSKETRNYRKDFTASVRGGTVEGNFDRYTVMTWLNYDIAPYGYCYLIPFSEREASISLAIPDLPENQGIDINKLWEHFYLNLQSQLSQELPITDRFQITKYPFGICNKGRVGNTFHVGNTYGSMMPFLGFGQFVAMVSGVFAAYDICGIGKYEELMKTYRQSYENSLVLRRAMEQVSNEGLDRIVQSFQGYWGEKLFHTKTINPLGIASYLLRPYLKLKRGVIS